MNDHTDRNPGDRPPIGDRVTLPLPAPAIEWLDGLAEQRGTSRNEQIRFHLDVAKAVTAVDTVIAGTLIADWPHEWTDKPTPGGMAATMASMRLTQADLLGRYTVEEFGPGAYHEIDAGLYWSRIETGAGIEVSQLVDGNEGDDGRPVWLNFDGRDWSLS